ncbi:stage III sporulation protein AA [Clostridium acetobutylicum]|uniref:Stage III sporulation protein AA, SpoIIIAA n=1 Tax=Clostridium acetobutylicum (strain ATCC 824 / DSM 792 / JCM 1419 / IAM 19013 / LMG 5710 / NBRC 13948 / NRRL B-527 / VKM B-1787 / 2291 / W) TaxID=272562 RepID=Q97HB9_CLOAB|nr:MULTISPECIES: stage III sporulation protein AA [Clostridium]AAK80052.1 Stage III sporulation protein AA, SpoIIIAA [Clostridium acetobutylicum ATCC 824]ADZ21144.1 Stage III sporulation protein AA, SpoIIIAA [Clostridium acetobutylicum EA 2018]AEI32177.1 stage III sporulation protein AA, SpoIIIAA [Clostridium acetobutylicum DSM 1731]AWV79520.1 stage III sporulation protein AA [Clostridium acetobutylicum]MBC2394506.1 stage III sporulation protein AA [Clostridium acetobutylicum]
MNLEDIFSILPEKIEREVKRISDYNNLQEIRIKVNKPLIIQIGKKEIISNYIATKEDLKKTFNVMSGYSIYSVEDELRQGYITIKGGHRVGICGDCVLEENKIKTIKNISSLNIRICKEVTGCSNSIMKKIVYGNTVLNTIIISPPNCGKTTLLRDITRNISYGINSIQFRGKKVCVIDERSEIGACLNGVNQMDIGIRTDILDNCPKSIGIMMAIRSMAPEVIICDEIGTYDDIKSILTAVNCGVKLITTIHGFGIEDLNSRDVFKDAIKNNVFERAIVLSGRSGVGTVEYIYDFYTKERERGL